MKEELNYYKILGVHEKASNYELRKAFCKLTKELHPDTTALNKDEAKTKLQSVLEAYENLNNPKLRNLYDIKLKSIFIKNQEKNLNIRNAYLSDYNSRNFIGNRRPFSNGEVFSLFLLALVICLCLLLSILFAGFTGKEFYSIPEWMNK